MNATLKETWEALMVVNEVELFLDGIESEYRIVRLTTDRHAFIWGNVAAHVGSHIPRDLAIEPNSDRGVIICDTFEDCVREWRHVGEAFEATGNDRAAAEILGAIARPA